MYMENPREGIKKNHGLSKNITFLLGLASITYQKEISLQWSYHFLPTNSPLSSQNISCPRGLAPCFFYTLRNMAKYKDKC